MKKYVLASALKTWDEVVDIDDVRVFDTLEDARYIMWKICGEMLDDDDKWIVFSEDERKVKLTQYDNEFVCCIREIEF